ncbi:LysR family transcriptional regulator [Rhizohabitans arisaemae]|uniref:LysR family transcriptional regulator n=1 Tax=Rhizohabitans arisaemae TaxID=2720610 RepID=UPI0024B0CFC4|nr:LysR family transcriptional regulator [Rhizohabitans arisaemae]
MELREIEIFLTLAEELHFGRTAERLRLTQGRVSQAIKKQERLIGAALFERTSRKVALTEIGRQLYADLKPVQSSIDVGLERAKLAARGKTRVLRMGLSPFNLADLRTRFDAFTQRHPDVDVRFSHVEFGDGFGPLRRNEIDIALLWLPIREADLTVGPVLFTEPMVLAMSSGHRLAGRESVSLEDLGDEVVAGGITPDYWREAIVPARTPGGRLIEVGPVVDKWADMLPILSNGEAVSPIHAHAVRYASRPDLVYVPIHDAPSAQWAPIWRTAAESDLILDFSRIVRDMGTLAL